MLTLPCNHKHYLGVARWPKEYILDDRTFIRVNYVKIWKPEEYEIGDKDYCPKCPPDMLWLDDIPAVSELEDTFAEVDLEPEI